MYKADSDKLIICQGRYRLEADFLERRAYSLDVPVSGAMCRKVEETLSAPARYRFYDKNSLVFDEISACASFEFSNVDVLRQKG